MTCATLAALILAVPASAQDQKVMDEKQVAAAGGVRLTGPQIVAAFAGNSAVSIRVVPGPNLPKGTTVSIYYRDARTRVVRAGTVIEATWWTDGDMTCAENKVERIGHVCGSVWRLGSDYLYCERGTKVCEWQLRLLPGNAFNL
jgi:hypothetical protein